jgi:hypothetical protein
MYELFRLNVSNHTSANAESPWTTSANWDSVKEENEVTFVKMWLLIEKKLGECISSSGEEVPTDVSINTSPK